MMYKDYTELYNHIDKTCQKKIISVNAGEKIIVLKHMIDAVNFFINVDNGLTATAENLGPIRYAVNPGEYPVYLYIENYKIDLRTDTNVNLYVKLYEKHHNHPLIGLHLGWALWQ